MPYRRTTSLLALTGILALLFASGCGEADPSASTEASVQTLEEEHEHASQLYTCGMHPNIVQQGPGQCPICGMDLTPMRAGGSSEGVVEVDPVTLQNIGVKFATVETTALSRRVRTTGRFEANERGKAVISPKIGGWIETLHVDYEGARVRKGQPLMDLYSPELVSTQEEYLMALRHYERMEGSRAAEDAKRVVDAARRRLAYWDMTDEQIADLARSGEPSKTVTFFSPASGTVTVKNVAAGQQVRAGENVMEVTNLSPIWLQVDVFEQDLAWVNVGTTADVELPYEPGQMVEGRVDYIYDTIDPATRSARARIVLPNPGYRFKPGMYATVTLTGDAADEGPTVPVEAVVRTGERSVVIMALGDGRFRPVEVRTGLEAAEQVQVLEGLEGGERIVTSAQFLIDSEARLQSAVGAMVSGHQHGDAPMAGAGAPAGSDDPIDLRAMDANGDGTVFQCTTEPWRITDSGTSLATCEGPVEEVTLGAAHTALHKMGNRNAPVHVAVADVNGDGQIWQCPMDWAVLHDEAGRCEVCGMFLVEYSLEQAGENLSAAGYQVPEGH